MRNALSWIKEMAWSSWDVSRSSWWAYGAGSLRGLFRSANFFRRPRAEGTTIDYDLARSLYRNDDPKYKYGAGFAKPIVDLTVEYTGLPTVSMPDAEAEAFLNECIRDYWAPALQQAMRDAARDSKVVVRFYQPRIDNPLFTSSDRDHGCVEVLPPESVDLTFDPVDKNHLEQAVVTHCVQVDERTAEEVANYVPPKMVEHQIVETVTPDLYSYYDRSIGAVLTTWQIPNRLGYVPFWPIWNEYAADLGGGQSDLESVFPFIEAFHDVLEQTLAAHRYHSVPKIKFNVKSVENFVANNWPSAIDPETGKIVNGAQINWEGHEMLFMTDGEDAGFIEARSVLDDSKSLLDFLIDCICVAAETPRWALLANDQATHSSASVERFKKRVTRKRTNFTEMFVMLSKMALVAKNKVPNTPRLNWDPVSVDDLVSKGQAIQQLILGFDVATQHGWMADKTAVKILCTLFPEMSAPEIEMALAEANVIVPAATPAPASSTQAQHLPAPSSSNGNGNSNGKGVTEAAVKKMVKKTLATTKPSRS